jgi:hypothetical protein
MTYHFEKSYISHLDLFSKTCLGYIGILIEKKILSQNVI